MKFQHAGLWLYPDVITRVKLQVDWSNALEDTAYECLKSGALVVPMIVDLETVLRTTVTAYDTLTCRSQLQINCLTALLLRGPPCVSAQGPSAP